MMRLVLYTAPFKTSQVTAPHPHPLQLLDVQHATYHTQPQFFWECLLHVSTTRVALPTGVEPG
jgi:hypothetical protein